MSSKSVRLPTSSPFQWPVFVVAALVLGATTTLFAWNFVWPDPVLQWRDGRLAADLTKDSASQVPRTSDADVFAAALLAACDRQCDSVVVVTNPMVLEPREQDFVRQDWDLSSSERAAAAHLIQRSRLPYEIPIELGSRNGIHLASPSWTTDAEAPPHWALSAPGFDSTGNTAFVFVRNRSCPSECGWMDLFGLSRSSLGWQVYGRMRWVTY